MNASWETVVSSSGGGCSDLSDAQMQSMSKGQMTSCADAKAKGMCQSAGPIKAGHPCCQTCGALAPPCPIVQFMAISSKLQNCKGDQKCESALTMQLPQSCLACLRNPANKNDASSCL
eukprot:COSAG01_NODE_48531_length_380_cov_1.117438_1_plen_117_part_01